MAITLNFGSAKGQPVDQLQEKDLKWYFGVIAEKLLADPGKAYADKDRTVLTALRGELVKRFGHSAEAWVIPAAGPSNGGSSAIQRTARAASPQPQSTALTRSGSAELSGANRDLSTMNAKLTELAEKCHLISPATSVPSLPEGFELAFSLIKVDPNPDNGEVYKTEGGKVALGGVALARVSAAAGITWNPHMCQRIDDRSDPRYVEYRAVGAWKLFDGDIITETCSRAVDLREGSDETAGMTEKSLAQQRKFIVALAESKAKNRVIRRLGLKSGYTPAELRDKPFAVVRLMWTGRSNDPQLAREFALMKAQQMTGGMQLAYGQPAVPPPLLQQRTYVQAPALPNAPYYVEPQQQLPPAHVTPLVDGSDYGDDEDEQPPAQTVGVAAPPAAQQQDLKV